MISYLSPTSINMFLENPETFYVKYMSPYRPREPQTQPMSIGSAFDAYVKAFLHKQFVNDGDPTYELETLLTKQVEPHNLEWARKHGAYAYQKYRELGALADLVLDLQTAVGATGVCPMFETTLQKTIGGVPLLGKPDLYFSVPNHTIVFDWKVNGYCSKSPVSPVPGYIRVRGGRSTGSSHPDAVLDKSIGMTFNKNGYFENHHRSWALQLAIYAWVLSEDEPSKDLYVAVDQLCCKPSGIIFPEIRVAEHRMIISLAFQKEMMSKIKDMWVRVCTGTIVSPERAKTLDETARVTKELIESNDPADKMFLEMTRPVYKGP